MPGSGQSATFEGQIFENDDRPSIEEMEARRVAKEKFRHEHNLFKVEVSLSFGARPEVQTEMGNAPNNLREVERDAPPSEDTTDMNTSSPCEEKMNEMTDALPDEASSAFTVSDDEASSVFTVADDETSSVFTVAEEEEASSVPINADDEAQKSELGEATQSESVSQKVQEQLQGESVDLEVEGELSFDFWLPVRKEGEGDNMWRICTGYAVRGYPWTSAIRSGSGNISVTGDQNNQCVTVSLYLPTPTSSSPSVPISISFPLPVAATWATHEEIQLATVYGYDVWGAYTAKVSRVRKEQYCKVHGFHEEGQAFRWGYDDVDANAAGGGFVSAFSEGLSYYLKYE